MYVCMEVEHLCWNPYKTFMDLCSNNMRSIISWYSLKEIYLSVYFSLLFLHFPIRVLEGI